MVSIREIEQRVWKKMLEVDRRRYLSKVTGEREKRGLGNYCIVDQDYKVLKRHVNLMMLARELGVLAEGEAIDHLDPSGG